MFRKHKYINFDRNATTPPTRHVLAVLRKIYREGYNNPSAAYFGAQKTAEAIERARQQVATALGCDSNEIIFTSGASESNSLIQANFILDVDDRSHHSFARMDYNYNGNIKAIPMIVSETGECLIDEVNSNPTKQYFLDLTQNFPTSSLSQTLINKQVKNIDLTKSFLNRIFHQELIFRRNKPS